MTQHYHGTPITPRKVLAQLRGRSFCISFARPDDVEWCHENGQSNMLDNSAFSIWTENMKRKARGEAIVEMDGAFWQGFYAWAERWLTYKTTWAVIPDAIMGDVSANDALIAQWPHGQRGAPVWHMHEPLDRLKRLCDEWERVCIGSSAQFRVVGAANWHHRMTEAMNAICQTGRVPNWLHMLRGMNAARWATHLPALTAPILPATTTGKTIRARWPRYGMAFNVRRSGIASTCRLSCFVPHKTIKAKEKNEPIPRILPTARLPPARRRSAATHRSRSIRVGDSWICGSAIHGLGRAA